MAKLFDGKYVVLTGVFSINRYKLTAKLREHGAIPVNKVDKRIDILIAGDGAGRRLEEAKHLKIRIMYEDELFNLLGNTGNVQNTEKEVPLHTQPPA